MTKFLKIIATIIFLIIWSPMQNGCLQSAKKTESIPFHILMYLFGLFLLFAGIYGIWKYKPNKKNDNQNLDKS